MASQNLTVPNRTVISGPVSPGKTFTIRGVIYPNAYRIEFNLRHRYGIAFHYNPRFDENVVVCNTWDGQWGPEERPAGMPFKEGQPFEVTIYCTDRRYNVSVNGQSVHSYSHRFQHFHDIDILDIRGDLQLNYVQA